MNNASEALPGSSLPSRPPSDAPLFLTLTSMSKRILTFARQLPMLVSYRLLATFVEAGGLQSVLLDLQGSKTRHISAFTAGKQNSSNFRHS